MTGYVKRLADPEVYDSIIAHPAVMVVGPRAIGKTTTASRHCMSHFDLSVAADRVAVEADPLAVLRAAPTPVMIDEWQLVPEVLSAVKMLVDQDQTRGQFVIAGSVRGDLDSETWPGTGRLIRVPMFGLCEREIEGTHEASEWFDGLLNGGRLPDIHTGLGVYEYVERALRSGFPEPALNLAERERGRWLSSYVQQLVTRDAQEIDGGRDPARLMRYLQALALNTAGTVEDKTLYAASGINKRTAAAYDRLLMNLLVIEHLPAWTSNRLKRMTLAPKRHLVDPGLLVGVLGLTKQSVMRSSDLLGRLMETFVTAQLRAQLEYRWPKPQLFHLRTEGGRREVDLIIEVGVDRLIAIEVKATSAPKPADVRHLRWLKSELGEALSHAVLLHTGPRQFTFPDGIVAAPIAALWH